MGRGRAKAKQTKVARQLKYSTGMTDLERLQAELAGQSQPERAATVGAVDDVDEADPYVDPYADYVDEDEDEREDHRTG